MQRITGFLFIALAAFFWAFTGPIARYAMENGIGPLEVAFWRAFFGGCTFLLHASLTRSVRVPGRMMLILFAYGVVNIAMLFGVYLVAIEQAGVALAAILMYTAPAWVAILSRLVFKEEITRLKIMALALAIGGAALACASGGGLPQGASALGVALSLLSGLLYSLNYIFNKHYLRFFSSITIYAWCMPVGALVLFPLVDFAPKAAPVWLALVAVGVVSAYAAYWCYCEGLKRLNPTLASVTATLEPISAAILAWIIFGEQLPLSGWIGTALVLAGVFVSILGNKPQDDGGNADGEAQPASMSSPSSSCEPK
ncbi:DMT family transporter [Desulfovibrio sp. OttesenSCG-928-I05]|nr:DMT family transporter [Desulfovibrio sp. OttesenSCG-928-I05]